MGQAEKTLNGFIKLFLYLIDSILKAPPGARRAEVPLTHLVKLSPFGRRGTG